MTTEVKIAIINIIEHRTGLHQSLCIDITDEIENIIDKAVGNAIMEGCELGNILEAVGLKITGI